MDKRIFFEMMNGIFCGFASAVLGRILKLTAKLAFGQALEHHLLIRGRHVPIRHARRHVFARQILCLVTRRTLHSVNALAVFAASHALSMRRHRVALRRNVARRMAIRTASRKEHFYSIFERRPSLFRIR